MLFKFVLEYLWLEIYNVPEFRCTMKIAFVRRGYAALLLRDKTTHFAAEADKAGRPVRLSAPCIKTCQVRSSCGLGRLISGHNVMVTLNRSFYKFLKRMKESFL